MTDKRKKRGGITAMFIQKTHLIFFGTTVLTVRVRIIRLYPVFSAPRNKPTFDKHFPQQQGI